ncbi:hypothetical protein QTP88_008908 [Uroleucon formosanum]
MTQRRRPRTTRLHRVARPRPDRATGNGGGRRGSRSSPAVSEVSRPSTSGANKQQWTKARADTFRANGFVSSKKSSATPGPSASTDAWLGLVADGSDDKEGASKRFRKRVVHVRCKQQVVCNGLDRTRKVNK